jgi:hypothetical protein
MTITFIVLSLFLVLAIIIYGKSNHKHQDDWQLHKCSNIFYRAPRISVQLWNITFLWQITKISQQILPNYELTED